MPRGDSPPIAPTPDSAADGGWKQRHSFGAYLRGVREELGLGLREAAVLVNLSYSYVSKIETGARDAPPSLKVLQRLSDAYYRDIREILYEAGLRPDVVGGADEAQVDLDARFHQLVAHPRLRPPGMNKTVEGCLSPLVKAMWIEFALKLAADQQQDAALDVPIIVSGVLDDPDIESFVLDEKAGRATKVRRKSRGEPETKETT
jgi:transcriptional regulator with XRE-family HTH domain